MNPPKPKEELLAIIKLFCPGIPTMGKILISNQLWEKIKDLDNKTEFYADLETMGRKLDKYMLFPASRGFDPRICFINTHDHTKANVEPEIIQCTGSIKQLLESKKALAFTVIFKPGEYLITSDFGVYKHTGKDVEFKKFNTIDGCEEWAEKPVS